MKPTTARITTLAITAAASLLGAANAQGGGYFYRPRSFYVTPPIYANLPVFGQPPIVYYEPVITAPPPVAGYYAPLAAPVTAAVPGTVGAPVTAPAATARERQVSTPHRTRYRSDAVYHDGSEQQYRYRQSGGRVRFSERWDD